ncbi:hypothetical protein GDO86_011665, partial [Hymenochirus boettgeri]
TSTPPVVQRFLNTRCPNPGVRTVFYGKANDPHFENDMTHGVITRPSLSAGALINLPPKTFFQQRLNDRKESIYISHQQHPLGKQSDQRRSLPATVDLVHNTFGCKSAGGESATSTVNPPKSFKEVEEESQRGHQLYLVSHNDYNVGEQRVRNYDCGTYRKDNRFGTETPHFNDGRHVARTLQWLSEIKMKEQANIVSKRVDDFKERLQHQLGKVHDPIAETMNIPPDYTFGISTHHHKHGVRDALDFTTSKDFLRGKDKQRTIQAAVHQHLKKTKYENFGLLSEAFRYYDKKNVGKITEEELKRVCFQFGLDLDADLFEFIFEYCEKDKDDMINYSDFIKFVNWKDKMTTKDLEEKLPVQGKIHKDWSSNNALQRRQGKTDESSEQKQHDEEVTKKTLKTLSKVSNEALDQYRTTSSRMSAVVGGPGSFYHQPRGLPSIRTDIAPPRIRKLFDTKNYGNESNVFGLICPSIYSNNMIFEEDLLKPRPKEEWLGTFTQILGNIDFPSPVLLPSAPGEKHDQLRLDAEENRKYLNRS